MAQSLSPASRRVIEAISIIPERSKQVRIGPSEIGDICQRCLAERLIESYNGTPRDPQALAIASWLGTSAHAAIEKLGIEDAFQELKVTVGEIEGIGPITGSVDFYDRISNQIVDFKFSNKKKISNLARAFTTRENNEVLFDNNSRVVGVLQKYYTQQMLYGKGIIDTYDYPVDSVSLLLIPRDASIETFENGITELRFAFDKSVADAMLARASEILAWSLDHPDELDDLESDPQCYYCNMERGKQWL